MQEQPLHHPEGGLRLFKSDVLESLVGLIVISPYVTLGRMLQEDEEVHQMSSDNNQKAETRYVLPAPADQRSCGEGPAQGWF